MQIVGNFTGVFPLFTEFKLRMFVMRYFNFSEVRYYPLLTDVSEIICPAETHVHEEEKGLGKGNWTMGGSLGGLCVCYLSVFYVYLCSGFFVTFMFI